MTGVLEIDGKFLHPIKEAAGAVSYSRDYITRLAREGKIVASYIGRQWFVDVDSLKHYIETAVIEQEVRKKQLSAERKLERQLRGSAEAQRRQHLKKAESLHTRAVVAASFVLGFGLLSGVATHQLITSSESSGLQVASTQTSQVSQSSMESVIINDDTNFIPLSNDSDQLVNASLTQELRPMGDVQNGIILLPSGSTATVTELFSDKVVVREMPDGTEGVVRVDAAGNVVGNTMPFVVVPVEHE